MVSATTPISREIASGRARRGGADEGVNVSDLERWLSGAGGGLALLGGLNRGSLLMTGLGGALLYRAFSGHCPMYGVLGVNTAENHNPVASIAAGEGVKVVRAMTINRPADELYRLWRNFEGLPRFMAHLESVKVEGKRSHWKAHGPAGTSVEWDAEIINDEPGRLIAWRSLEGSEVSTAGSVVFRPAPGDRGTEVVVTLKYDPPGGKLGSWLAWLFGEEPSLQVRDDLRRFKQLVETGEVPTTEGQPSCRG
jgi:uncharacterized membrane protein